MARVSKKYHAPIAGVAFFLSLVGCKPLPPGPPQPAPTCTVKVARTTSCPGKIYYAVDCKRCWSDVNFTSPVIGCYDYDGNRFCVGRDTCDDPNCHDSLVPFTAHPDAGADAGQ